MFVVNIWSSDWCHFFFICLKLSYFTVVYFLYTVTSIQPIVEEIIVENLLSQIYISEYYIYKTQHYADDMQIYQKQQGTFGVFFNSSSPVLSFIYVGLTFLSFFLQNPNTFLVFWTLSCLYNILLLHHLYRTTQRDDSQHTIKLSNSGQFKVWSIQPCIFVHRWRKTRKQKNPNNMHTDWTAGRLKTGTFKP